MTAAAGSVVTQVSRIREIVSQRAERLTVPMPKMAPQETCVVETGTPRLDANSTSAAVVIFAVKPWPGLSGVIRLLMVSAT